MTSAKSEELLQTLYVMTYEMRGEEFGEVERSRHTYVHGFLKLFRNTSSDALCTTGYYGYFSFEIHAFLIITYIFTSQASV